MVKYVYPGINKSEIIIHFYDVELAGIPIYLKSVHPEGRIIADDNELK